MAEEYNKSTVAQIREQFKARGIPTTGLTKKAQLIERLVAEDAKNAVAPEEETAAEVGGHSVEEAVNEVVEQKNARDGSEVKNTNGMEQRNGKEGTQEKVKEHEETPPNVQEVDSSSKPEMQPVAGVGLESKVAVETTPTVNVVAPAKETESSVEQAAPLHNLEPDPIASPPSTMPDTKKRKRRSGSPTLSENEIEQKKLKQQEEHPQVHLKEDGDVKTKEAHDDVDMEDAGKSRTTEVEPMDIDSHVSPKESSHPKETPQSGVTDTISKEPSKEALIKALQPTSSPTTPAIPSADRPLAPAIHPATTALYIRNLKRPLRPDALRNHLITISRSDSAVSESDANTESLPTFHLDPIRTHAFAIFPSIATAARARSALHDVIWPAEREREALWVDFVPEESVSQWIAQEAETAGARPKRWEVVYTRQGESVVPQLVEVGSVPPAMPAPSVKAAARPPTPEVRAEAAPFVALDALFQVTRAKPKLYFQPVPATTVARRTETLAQKTSRRNVIPSAGSGLSDSRRYTFEGDELVDGGPEFGLRNGGGGRGGFRGRGFRGRRGW